MCHWKIRSQRSRRADLATLANLPDFVDPDEAVVSSWFADYKSEDVSAGSVAWLAEVASNPQRSDRLGVGATSVKVADQPEDQPAKELQPLGKAAKKAMNRRPLDDRTSRCQSVHAAACYNCQYLYLCVDRKGAQLQRRLWGQWVLWNATDGSFWVSIQRGGQAKLQ
eukprot:Skav236264  [mRNA]  locus=scaffold829:666752:674773:- [translate_table: standard]